MCGVFSGLQEDIEMDPAVCQRGAWRFISVMIVKLYHGSSASGSVMAALAGNDRIALLRVVWQHAQFFVFMRPSSKIFAKAIGSPTARSF